MRTLYLDIFSGMSGDMFVGALLDLGVDFKALDRELRRLGLAGYHLHMDRRQKSGIEGVKFDVHIEGGHEGCDHDHTHDHDHSHSHDHGHAHPHEHAHEHAHEHPHPHPHPDASGNPAASRDLGDIRQIIHTSPLSGWVKEKSLAVFHRIAVAEGKIHGHPPERVHFHEVGALDSIIDIVGSCVALEMLGKPRILAAPVVEGTGWVKCAHGRFPVPTPATLEILGARGIPLTQCDEPHELLTPTGAALLAEFAESFGPMGSLVASRVGYGLGTRDNRTRPNVLRAVLSESQGEPAPGHDWESDTIAVLETNLDDIPAEILGHVIEKAMRLGALDAFHTPVQMKKNRPGVLLTILCSRDEADSFCELLLTETSAFGVRRSVAERRKLRREVVDVPTAHGRIQVKIGKLNGRVIQVAPEFESCRHVAVQAGVPVKEVYEAALAAAQALRTV